MEGELRERILCVRCSLCFFFSSRRRHTRFKCDWSSDCALPIYRAPDRAPDRASDGASASVADGVAGLTGRTADQSGAVAPGGAGPATPAEATGSAGGEIGRASCRGRVEISGGAVSFKKKKKRARGAGEKKKKRGCSRGSRSEVESGRTVQLSGVRVSDKGAIQICTTQRGVDACAVLVYT